MNKQIDDILQPYLEKVRPATFKNYNNTLLKLFTHKPLELDLFNDSEGTIKYLMEHPWNPELKPSSLQSTLAVCMALTRNKPVYSLIESEFNILKKKNNQEQDKSNYHQLKNLKL